MEPSVETQKKSGVSNKVVITCAIVVVLIVVIAAAAIVFAVTQNKDDSANAGVGYSTTASVILDEESLKAAADEAAQNAQDGNVALRYKNNAYSINGLDFECYIVNSASNQYDMYLTIYADANLTDRLFLSQLVPPGSGFQAITLEHTLETGSHMVYVVVTQVDTDENGIQYTRNQVIHTMDFHVEE